MLQKSATNDNGENHDANDHRVEHVRPNLSIPTGTDEIRGNRGLDSAVASDVSRRVGVMTWRQAADLEASLGGSHLLQAMPTTHVATVIEFEHKLKIMGGGNKIGVIGNK